MKLVVTCITVLLFLMSGLVTTPAHSVVSNDKYEHRIQYQINQARAERGINKTYKAPCPERTAEAWALHLKRTGRLYHQNIYSVVERCDALGAGEVLARGTMTPRRAVRLWMDSPIHRKVILNSNYKRIGVGVRWVPQGRVIVVNFVY